MKRRRPFWLWLAPLLGLGFGFWLWLTASPIKRDEQIVFLPALGRQTPNGLEVLVKGFVFEPEGRPGARLAVRKFLGLDEDTLTAEERSRLEERTRAFLIDTESRKDVRVRVGDVEQDLAPTDGDGAFAGTVLLPAASTSRTVTAVLPTGDARRFEGRIVVVPPRGLSVVSDIDDTIKLSQVLERRELLLNTFVRPFKPVTNMAALYRDWQTREKATFHYLSSSPWQLFPALDGFLRTNGFPEGSVHLRAIRLREELFGEGSSQEHKLTELRRLLGDFPEREFVLVGDSGERDPEIYGTIAREFPGRIRRIFIRDVTGQAAAAPRYLDAFRGLPPERWEIFTEPQTLRVP